VDVATILYFYLVGGFNPSEKYEFVNGKDDIPYMKWKIKHVPNHQPVYHQQSLVFRTSKFSRRLMEHAPFAGKFLRDSACDSHFFFC